MLSKIYLVVYPTSRPGLEMFKDKPEKIHFPNDTVCFELCETTPLFDIMKIIATGFELFNIKKFEKFETSQGTAVKVW